MIAIILHLYYKCKEGFDVAEITKSKSKDGSAYFVALH